MLFTRNLTEVQVISENGQRKIVNIPENIGTRMMESGQMLSFIPVPDLVIDSVCWITCIICRIGKRGYH